MTSPVDPDIYATLSDEERAAIDGGLTQSEAEALRAIAGDDDDDEVVDADGNPVDTSAILPETPESAADQPKQADDTAAPESTADDATPPAATPNDPEFVPTYRAELPEDFEQRVTAVNDGLSSLAQQFKNGDIEFEDYQAKTAELYAERDTLNEARIKASISADMNQQTAEQQWNFAVNRFATAVARDEGIDYRADAAKQRDLDTFVIALGKDPANGDKPMPWFLEEAHKRVKALHGIADKAPKSASLDQAPPAKKTVDRKPDLSVLPKTLAQVPGGDGPGDIGSEFAAVDAMGGEDLEAAIAAMSPAQRARYQAGR